jgi:hypothetical protein
MAQEQVAEAAATAMNNAYPRQVDLQGGERFYKQRKGVIKQ